MSSFQSISSNVVHEAVDERQYVRVMFPARAVISVESGTVECNIHDVSLGGMGLITTHPFKKSSVYPAKIHIDLNGMQITLGANIRIVGARGNSLGAHFVEIEQDPPGEGGEGQVHHAH